MDGKDLFKNRITKSAHFIKTYTPADHDQIKLIQEEVTSLKNTLEDIKDKIARLEARLARIA